MKSFEEIKDNQRITVEYKGMDGFRGIISMPTWIGSVICSKGGGWCHVSVAPFKKNVTPNWHEMCMIKDIFFNEDEAVIQVHPPKAEYVNNKENCLHLWQCYYKEMVLPPSCFVGIKKGQSPSELKKEIKEAYTLAGEPYYE